jgi:hypothetical protein
LKLNRDRLNNADQQASAIAAMAVIDSVQRMPAEQQLVGIAAAFLLYCETHRISAQDAFAVTKNVTVDQVFQQRQVRWAVRPRAPHQ